MPKKLRWLRSPTGSDGKPWKNWRLWRRRIRCWPGTESSSPTGSTDRSFAKFRGRPRVDEETERLVVRMAKENPGWRSEEHTSELQSLAYLVCRLLLEKKQH